MANDWILEVLADLKNFAQANGMDALAKQLDATAVVAKTELRMHHVSTKLSPPIPKRKL